MINGTNSVPSNQAQYSFNTSNYTPQVNFNSAIKQISPETQNHVKSLASPYLQLAENQQTEEYIHPFGEGVTPMGVTGVGIFAETTADTAKQIQNEGVSPELVGAAIFGAVTRGAGKKIDTPKIKDTNDIDTSKNSAPTNESKPSTDLSASQKRAVNGLEEQVELHRKKLEDYRKDPDAFDNKGFLTNATPEVREKIISARIRSLENQIDTFIKDIEAIKSGSKSVLEKK